MAKVVLSGAASEVFLADDANVRQLERGDVNGFRGYGGPFDRSPVRLGVGGRAVQGALGLGWLLPVAEFVSWRWPFVSACPAWRVGRSVTVAPLPLP